MTNTTHFPPAPDEQEGTDVVTSLCRANVRVVSVYELPTDHIDQSGWCERWKYAYWKLQIFRLTEYKKLIVMDSDAILTRSVDQYFNLPAPSFARNTIYCTESLFVRGYTSTICGGFMMIEPSEETFQGLMQYSKKHPPVEYADQLLLEQYFSQTGKGPINYLDSEEVTFGHCMFAKPTSGVGKASNFGVGNMPYVPKFENRVAALFTPAFVHKDGWGEGVNGLNNVVCFKYDAPEKCQKHPLGPYWYSLFCESLALVGLSPSIFPGAASSRCTYSKRVSGKW